MKNLVLIKGRKDRLEINLNPEVDFFELQDALKEKIIGAKSFIGNNRQAIEFTGRVLTIEEEKILTETVVNNCDVILSFVFSNVENDKNTNITNLLEGKPAKFYYKNLRSGGNIEFDGHVVVIGDVNPGAIIKAGGSVIVIGHLNGTVYAGLDGDKDAIIGAIYLNPVQMNICSNTAIGLQKEILDTNRVKKNTVFRIAKLVDEKIIIEERG